jgi:CRP/FNR family nitrogen fixation transcriptional regulator
MRAGVQHSSRGIATACLAPPTGSHTVADSVELAGFPMSVVRQQEIYGQMEPADCFYKVISGAVRTSRTLIDGRRQIGGFYLPGDAFGLEAGTQRAFSAEAVVESRLEAISRSVAFAIAAWDDEAARQLWSLIGTELRRAQDHSLLLIKSAPERVASFLVELAERNPANEEIVLPMSRQDIADYLGLAIETVSRTLMEFEHASIIALATSKRVVLRDRAGLTQLVD